MNVDAMLRSLTAKQFLELEAYSHMDPFIEARADYRAAQIVTVIANVHRGSKQKPYKVEDFILRFEDADQIPQRGQTNEQKEAIARAIVAAFNAPGRDSDS